MPRRLPLALAAGLALATGGAWAQTLELMAVPSPALASVPKLDLDRYVGTWHEVARYPNFFERMCVRDVTATYSRNANGTVRVVNECRKEDGEMARAEGAARLVQAPSQFEVRFAPEWLAWMPFVWANYWVIELADDYSYAVVSEPSRDYLWILAREPRMSDARYGELLARLKTLGFEPGRVYRNPAS